MNVVVVGSVNVDLVVQVADLPAPGETVVGRRLERFGGGKGANAAVAAARAGATVEFVGAVGRDDLAAIALDGLRRADVGVTRIAEMNGESTGTALITVARNGENQITVAAGANAALSASQVRATLASVLHRAGCVLVGTEIAADATLAAVRAAREAGVVCVLNPAPVSAPLLEVLPLGLVLTPNSGECRALAGLVGLDPSGPVTGLAAALAGRVHAAIVVTLGSDGLLVCSPGSDPVHVPARTVEVVDTTGAGDVINGVLAARLAAGDDLLTAARAANEAGAEAVTRSGAR